MREVIIDGEKITFIKVKTSTGKIFEIPTVYFKNCCYVTISTGPVIQKKRRNKMAIYCDVCGRQLAWDKSECCNADILKMKGEDFSDVYYRCKKCGCICYPKVDKEMEEK